MCGIICHYHATQEVDTKELLNHYLCQRSRGHDGFGFSYVDGDGMLRTLRFTEEAEAFFALGQTHSSFILLHHRFPTSTKNEERFNQPITRIGKYSSYVLAHNGVINNAWELKRDEFKDYPHDTQGDSVHQYNDSEALLHSLVDVLERKRKKVLAAGSIAFVLAKTSAQGKLTRVYFGRNTNPLFWRALDDGTQIISSTFSGETEKGMIKEDTLYNVPLYGKEKLNALTTDLHLPIVTPYKAVTTTYPRTNWDKKEGTKIDPLDDDGDWEKWGSDGSWYQKNSKYPLIGEAKPTKILDEKSQKQADYLETLNIAKQLKEDCDVVHVRDMSNDERQRALKEIDDIIVLMNLCSQDLYQRETTMVAKLKEELIAHRLNILPLAIHIPTTSEQIEMSMNIQSLYEREGY